MTTHGVVLFNAGNKCLVRAAVCLATLRKHYTGPVCFMVDESALDPQDERGIDMMCQKWAAEFKPVSFRTEDGKHRTFLNKCLLHKHSPFDTSLLVDLDCTIHGDITPMLRAADEDGFAVCQFADWEVKGKIKKRVDNWLGILPGPMMQRAYDYPAAINTGVYAWRRDSHLMRDWWEYAVKGRESWIPDETCCQAMLASYRHRLMPARFNASCRYGDIEGAAVIHFHGRKHCRFNDEDEFIFNSQVWYREFEKLRALPFMGPRWIQADRQLRKHLPTWDAVKADADALCKLRYPRGR